MWEYSEETVEIMKAFGAAFPEVVAAVEGAPDRATYTPEQLFPRHDDPRARLQETLVFLAQVRARTGVAVAI